MKKVIIAATVAILAASGSASAADLPRGPAPYYSSPAPMGIYNWGGFYGGVNAGYEWGKVTNSGTNPSGIAGGAQIGYNWQNGQFVLGAETDLQASAADDTFATYKFANPWFGTLRGRAGYAVSNLMFFATLGLAYGGVKATGIVDESKTQTGWTGGLGMEVGFAPNWSAKVEYLYMDLGSRAYTVTNADNGLQSNILRLGINYHF